MRLILLQKNDFMSPSFQISKKLTFVTGSLSKFSEALVLFPNLVHANCELPEIQESNSKVILDAKVEAARKVVEGDFFVEDVSLVFEALAPFPGPLIKWFVRDVGLESLAAMAAKLGNTRAKASCRLGAMLDGKYHYFEGEICGHIRQPRGDNGFGWDAIFCPGSSEQTFAEMSDIQKQKYSMRIIVLQKLKETLHV